MVEVGPYPVESSFYPEHPIIPLVTLLIFVIMLYVLASISKKQIEAASANSRRQERDKLVGERGTQEGYRTTGQRRN